MINHYQSDSNRAIHTESPTQASNLYVYSQIARHTKHIISTSKTHQPYIKNAAGGVKPIFCLSSLYKKPTKLLTVA